MSLYHYKMRLFCALLLVFAVSYTESKVTEDEIDVFVNQFIELFSPHREKIKEWFIQRLDDTRVAEADYLTCELCRPALGLARALLNNDRTEADITRLISRVCKLIDLAPEDDICEPTIQGYVVPIVYILQNNDEEDLINHFCGIIHEGCTEVKEQYTNWTIKVAPGKPPRQVRPPLPDSLDKTKFLHFTDIHLDLDYSEGENTTCNYPICCRDWEKDAAPGAVPGPIPEPAGKYGHGRCGLSYAGMTAMFAHAKANHGNARYILITGDYIHSGVWLYNKTENERHITNVTQTLHEFFPDKFVVVVTGNHETPTVNMYPPPSVTDRRFSLDWMYNAMSNPFENKSMGDAAQIASFKHAGNYTVSPEPGLRFVILNTNICYIQNFWLPHDPVDPFDALKGFSQTMERAEKANEKVILVTHIPPGSGACWKPWSNQIARIINRYAHLISFQVYGHTHNEFYIVTLDSDYPRTEIPIVVGFTGPSAVAEGAGVAYKVYYVDGERGVDSTWELIDHETWMMDTAKSNRENTDEWYLEYTASTYFGLKSQRPEEYYNLTKRMIADKDLFEKFRGVYRKNNSDENFAPCKNMECVTEIICHTVDYNAADRRACNNFTAMLYKNEAMAIVNEVMESGTIRVNFSSGLALLLPFLLSVYLFSNKNCCNSL